MTGMTLVGAGVVAAWAAPTLVVTAGTAVGVLLGAVGVGPARGVRFAGCSPD